MRRLILLALALIAALMFGAPNAHAAHVQALNGQTVIGVDGDAERYVQLTEARDAWSKNTNVDLEAANCSGVNCVHVVMVDTTACDSGFEMGTVIAGCTFKNADGSYTCQIKNFDTTYGLDFLRAVMEHELGHAMGLVHNTTDPHSIMQPVIDTSNPPRGPDRNDRGALDALYP